MQTIFFKTIPSVLDHLINSKKTQTFLCGWVLFPDYLYISCDYDFLESLCSQGAAIQNVFIKKAMKKTKQQLWQK